MKHLAQVFFAIFWKFGGIGLLVLGILDSSFLFAPLGNDLLIVALTARHRSLGGALYYAAMSTVGSVLGCLLVDVVFRKAGEEGLKRHVSAGRLSYVRDKVQKRAGWALALASIAPPPFPFTPFLMAASALQYSRRRLLIVTGVARMVRFTSLAVLALFFGRRILKWGENDVVQGLMIGLIVVCTVGSVISVYGWLRRSRKPKSAHDGRGQAPRHEPAGRLN
jgi:membrane protein YqaA with SNARE-associated domain